MAYTHLQWGWLVDSGYCFTYNICPQIWGILVFIPPCADVITHNLIITEVEARKESGHMHASSATEWRPPEVWEKDTEGRAMRLLMRITVAKQIFYGATRRRTTRLLVFTYLSTTDDTCTGILLRRSSPRKCRACRKANSNTATPAADTSPRQSPSDTRKRTHST